MAATPRCVAPQGAAGADASDEPKKAPLPEREHYLPCFQITRRNLVCKPQLRDVFVSGRQDIEIKSGGVTSLNSFPFTSVAAPDCLPPHCIIFFYRSLSPSPSLVPRLSPPLPPILRSVGLSFELFLLSLSFPYITPSHPALSASDIPL